MDGTLVQNEVILGVDTHLDTHVGVVINDQGKVIGILTSIPTNRAGYLKLLTWARSLGNVGVLALKVQEHMALVLPVYCANRVLKYGKSIVLIVPSADSKENPIRLMLRVQHAQYFPVTQRQRQSHSQAWLKHCVCYRLSDVVQSRQEHKPSINSDRY